MGFITNIVRFLPVLLLQLMLQAKFSETKINFTENLLPDVDGYIPINSSAIETAWHPSSAAANTDFTQLSGTFNTAIYAGYRSPIYSATMIYPVTKLNETGKLVLAGLQPDTIYSVWFQQAWKDNGTTSSYTRSLFPTLVRTYTKSE